MVEIYREPELETMIYESGEIEEWKKEVEKLDLKGQQKMIQRDNNPSVYVLMNQSYGANRTLQMVADYNVPNVSEKVIRIIISYTNYVKRTVWFEG